MENFMLDVSGTFIMTFTQLGTDEPLSDENKERVQEMLSNGNYTISMERRKVVRIEGFKDICDFELEVTSDVEYYFYED